MSLVAKAREERRACAVRSAVDLILQAQRYLWSVQERLPFHP